MKLRQKIIINFLFLFLFIFNLGGIIVIENSHNLGLKKEIDRGLSEHLSIYSGVRIILSATKNSTMMYEKNENDILNSIIKGFLSNFNDQDINIELLDENNNKIFSSTNIKLPDEREEFQNPLLDRRQYIIRDVGERTYLFITNLLNIDNKKIKFSYIRDISEVYQERKIQYLFFLNVNVLITIVLVVGIYILSNRIINPINNLISSTQNIAQGNFSKKIVVNTNDEIGMLSQNFNTMAEAVEEKIKELEKSFEQKQRFIYNLTHELKTPLTSIIGYADFLRSTKYNEEVFLKGLNNIFQEGKRLEALSSKMMDLTLMKRENFKMKKENLQIILCEIEDFLKPKLENENIELIISAEELEVLVERDLIKNLILNLIDNAIKASNNGSKIHLNGYKDKDSKIVIEIKDEGIGIEEKELSKVFEPFYMVDKSRSRSVNGAGLGLAICAEIARIHEAEIKIESKIGRGTSIKIIFL